MRILTLIKQIPGMLDVRFRKDMTLDRDAAPAAVNPFDLCALEAAARLKDADEGTHICAMSMGPASALSALRDALAVCADEALLISDPSLRGADIQTTAQMIAAAIRKKEADDGAAFDMIFCGLRSTDGAGSAVGAMLSIFLNRPFVSDVLTCSVLNRSLICETESETAYSHIQAAMPCIVSFTKADYSVRYPKVIRIIEAQDAVIPVTDAGDSLPAERRTFVKGIRYHRLKKKSHMIKGKDPEAQAAQLASLMFGDHRIESLL